MTNIPSPARFIREKIFRVETQAEFGLLLGYSQAHINRFENGEHRISAEAQERIRALALDRGIRWDNNWFFEAPNSSRKFSTVTRANVKEKPERERV